MPKPPAALSRKSSLTFYPPHPRTLALPGEVGFLRNPDGALRRTIPGLQNRRSTRHPVDRSLEPTRPDLPILSFAIFSLPSDVSLFEVIDNARARIDAILTIGEIERENQRGEDGDHAS